MYIGTANTSIDLYDNPYFRINMYEMNEDWAPKLSEHQLEKCTTNYLETFMDK